MSVFKMSKVYHAFVCMSLLSPVSFAADSVSIQHALYTQHEADGKSYLTFELSIQNNGTDEIKNLIIEPAGTEFIGNPEKLRIKLPSLPATGKATTIWEASSYLTSHYFQFPSVLSFNVTGVSANANAVAFSVISDSVKPR